MLHYHSLFKVIEEMCDLFLDMFSTPVFSQIKIREIFTLFQYITYGNYV